MSGLRSLHREPFVMPDAWSVESAVLLETVGFEALSVTAGDSVREGTKRLEAIVAAVSIPINVELPAAHDPAWPEAAIDAGAAGLCVPGGEERVEAVSKSIANSGRDIVLTAHIEWFGESRRHRAEQAVSETVERLRPLIDAGADVVYVPGLSNLGEMALVSAELAETPLAVLVEWSTYLSVADLGRRGVRRVHLGPSLARIGWDSVATAARHVRERGDFSPLRSPLHPRASGW